MANPTQGISNALAAYADAARAATRGERTEIGASDAGAKDTFADLVKGAMHQSVDNGKAGESLSIDAVRDEADLHKVISAVAEAELTLETVVAVRDKVIDAYKEILRMPM
ncbi:MAG: flagellar hook-basal body complex protein FliE [Rhodospirillales bacterium]|jgi:flagellar hook-basal body complex protein FliE|nr:flagellar hook-basal body complex protein FliE [Rhodospirillales bacterium]MDP6805582.1 flagellar hook-basal body complex protein FliE [Rhodospirillales bacterium]